MRAYRKPPPHGRYPRQRQTRGAGGGGPYTLRARRCRRRHWRAPVARNDLPEVRWRPGGSSTRWGFGWQGNKSCSASVGLSPPKPPRGLCRPDTFCTDNWHSRVGAERLQECAHGDSGLESQRGEVGEALRGQADHCRRDKQALVNVRNRTSWSAHVGHAIGSGSSCHGLGRARGEHARHGWGARHTTGRGRWTTSDAHDGEAGIYAHHSPRLSRTGWAKELARGGAAAAAAWVAKGPSRAGNILGLGLHVVPSASYQNPLWVGASRAGHGHPHRWGTHTLASHPQIPLP
jgi:hypothetical protein